MVMVRDRGDILLGWLAKLVIGLGVVALLGFDAVTVGLATVSVQDQAGTAAAAARDEYAMHHDPQRAYQAALATAKAANPADVIKPLDFTVTTTGVVKLTLQRPIHTVVAHYLPDDKFKVATAGGTAVPGT
jgi:hypothetical protein